MFQVLDVYKGNMFQVLDVYRVPSPRRKHCTDQIQEITNNDLTKKTCCVTIKEIEDGFDLQHIQVKSLKTFFLSGRSLKNIPVYYNQLYIFYPTKM